MIFTEHELNKIKPKPKQDLNICKSRYGKDKYRLHCRIDRNEEYLGTFTEEEVALAEEAAQKMIKNRMVDQRFRDALKSRVRRVLNQCAV